MNKKQFRGNVLNSSWTFGEFLAEEKNKGSGNSPRLVNRHIPRVDSWNTFHKSSIRISPTTFLRPNQLPPIPTEKSSRHPLVDVSLYCLWIYVVCWVDGGEGGQQLLTFKRQEEPELEKWEKFRCNLTSSISEIRMPRHFISHEVLVLGFSKVMKIRLLLCEEMTFQVCLLFLPPGKGKTVLNTQPS